MIHPLHKFQVLINKLISLSGETGSYLYVAAEGQFEVIKDGKILGNLGVGKV